MVRVVGPLRVVTDRPLLVSRVRVRAARDRAEQGGLTAAFDDSVPVTDGRLEMVVLPGPAVMMLEVVGGFSHAVKLVVPDVPEATLEQCVTAAEIAGEADKRTLERLAGEVARDALAASEAARSASGSASEAATQAQAAGSSAGDAAESAKSAATSEAGAAGSAEEAAESAKSAATSEKNAASHASEAAQHEEAASRHADNARDDAERAATIAGSTRWVGTRLEVNGKLSQDLMPVLTISSRGTWVVNGQDTGQLVRGRDGTMSFEELTPAQRASLKGDKGDRGEQGPPGTTTWEGIRGKPEVSTRADGGTLVQRWSTGQISVPITPDSSGAATSKTYVDTTLANAKAYTDALIVVGSTYVRDGKLHIVYE